MPLSADPPCPVSYDKCYYAAFHIILAHAARVDHTVCLGHGSFGKPMFEQL